MISAVPAGRAAAQDAGIPVESELVCTKCGSRYPIEDGIPRMLPEDAIPPSESGV